MNRVHSPSAHTHRAAGPGVVGEDDLYWTLTDLSFEECDACQGTGLLPDTTDCARCGGVGTVEVWS